MIGYSKHQHPCQPGEEYQIDICFFPQFKNNKLTNQHPVMLLCDVASNYLICRPLINHTQATLISKIQEIFQTVPPAKRLISDSGPEFGNSFSQCLSDLGIQHVKGLLKSNSQGLVERHIEKFRHLLSKLLKAKNVATYDFQRLLFLTLQSLNNSLYQGTFLSPKELYFGPVFFLSKPGLYFIFFPI